MKAIHFSIQCGYKINIFCFKQFIPNWNFYKFKFSTYLLLNLAGFVQKMSGRLCYYNIRVKCR